ncbi:MAG TPA: response regulator [Nitrososphaeraceae archaeon]
MDDERDLAYLFGDALKSRGHSVEIFTDSIEAAEMIKSEHTKYALILTDVRMPGLSGIELGKEILQIDDKIKVILISAYELMENTALEYIKKPIEISKLVEIVDVKLE